MRIFIEGREIDDIRLFARDRRNIAIKGRLRGGMDIEQRCTRILCQNFNGYPTRKNLHKMKETEQLLLDKNVCIILETGANRQDKMMDLSENLELTRENKMPEVERA